MTPLLHRLRTSWGRFAAGAAALLSLAWLSGVQFTGVINWEPTAGFFVAVLAWIYSCFPDEDAQARTETGVVALSAHDRRLYLEFISKLDAGACDFLRQNDFGAAFLLEYISGLREVAGTWSGVAHEFDDPQLQGLFAPVLQGIKALSDSIAMKTQVLGANVNAVRVPREDQQFAYDTAQELNAEATEVADLIEGFVRTARKRL